MGPCSVRLEFETDEAFKSLLERLDKAAPQEAVELREACHPSVRGTLRAVGFTLRGVAQEIEFLQGLIERMVSLGPEAAERLRR